MHKKRSKSRIEKLGKDLLITNFFSKEGYCRLKPKKSRFLMPGILSAVIIILIAGIISIWAASDTTIPLFVKVPVSPLPLPTIIFSSDKTNVFSGESAALTWKTSDADSCTASTAFSAVDWTGIVNLNDSKTVTLPLTGGSYIYTLSCVNVTGTSSKNITIKVSTAISCGNGFCEADKGENETTCPADCKLEEVKKPIKPEEPVKPEPIFQSITEGGIFQGTMPGAPRLIMSTTTPTIVLGVDKAVDISWTSLDAVSCFASGVFGWEGVKNNIGRENIPSPQEIGNYVYVLVCEAGNGAKTTGFVNIKVSEKPSFIVQAQETITAVINYLNDFKAKPEVKSVARNVVRPLIAISVVISVYSIVISWFNVFLSLINYLINLLLQAFGVRKKRKPWGIVYDSATKEPVDLAIVRLFDAKTKILKQTAVTGRSGRFGFQLEKGKYYITVTKKTYIYPSKLIKGALVDGKYHNLYFQENILISSRKGLDISVPIDSVRAIEAEIRMVDRLLGLFIRIALPILIASFVLSIFVYWVDAVLINGLVCILYVFAFIFRKKLRGKALNPWGKVYDVNTGNSIAGVPIKVFDKKYSKLLETKISDRDGRFSFLLPKGEYFLRLASFKYQIAPENKAWNVKDNYFGETFKIEEKQTISINIPVSQIGKSILKYKYK